MLSFFRKILYTYNGDKMIEDVALSIKSSDDLKKISNKTKYINIATDNGDKEVVDYFINNGREYCYSELDTSYRGYVYVPYEIFRDGEDIIERMIDKIPNNFSTLEKVRYVYIFLGRLLSLDINSMEEKNDIISLTTMGNTQNIWGALVKRKITRKTSSILLMYVYSRMGIKCERVYNGINGSVANKIYLDDDNFIVVSLADDMGNIQGKFRTMYFDNYNDDRVIDKKIGYIKDKYMDEIIDTALGKISYTEENVLEEILSKSSAVLDIKVVGVYELCEIYRKIFKMYCPNYDIRINNLYVSRNYYQKEHFIVISYGDRMYSYNYSKDYFMIVDGNDLAKNIDSNRIGIYEDENFALGKKEAVL